MSHPLVIDDDYDGEDTAMPFSVCLFVCRHENEKL